MIDDKPVLVSRTLDGLTPTGVKTRINLSFGIPYISGRSFRCPARITGLDYDYTPPDMAGWDALQALLSSISLCTSLLEDFVSRGGSLLLPDTEEIYDPDNLRRVFCAATKH